MRDVTSPVARAASTLDVVLEELAADGRLVHVERIPARPARHGSLARPLPEELARRVPGSLWTHQVAAIDALRDRRSVVVATGTASGKSLTYQVPILEAATDRLRPGTSLALFPTKALAHDQLRAFGALVPPDVTVATFDGDAPPETRSWVRDHATVVLTNPDMVHAALLPNHARWSRFLMRLRYVVIDELHVYRGIFGTHLAHVLRRLRRICAEYGADPTFAFCSATIGEPDRLASLLCGSPVEAVTDDGSPAGAKVVALLNPPVVDAAAGIRTSTTAEAAATATRLVTAGHRTIVFTRSRRGTELIAGDLGRRLPEELAGTVRSYRSGYLAEERRQIEAEIMAGAVQAVVATNALELGVDIGGLDACVITGYPGTVASTRQQLGRAGRHGQQSVGVLVAGEDQLDQWLMAHPAELFTRPPEPAIVNPANPFVLRPHLACAAYELPLRHDDERWWGDELHDGVRELVEADELVVRRQARGPRAYFTGRGSPARRVGLRSGGGGEYRIVDPDGTLIGTVDAARAFSTVHPGACYLHRGAAWRVVDLDLDALVALVEPDDGATFTQARTVVDIGIERIVEERPLGGARLHLGVVEVSSQVVGYQRKETVSRRIVANEVLDLPPNTITTRAMWWVAPHELLDRLPEVRLPGALHAAEHATIGLLPLFAICDRWDVGGVSIAHHHQTGGPTVFVHDGYPGGAGVADLGYQVADDLLAAAADLIEACGCAAGCPSCIQSPKCGNGNEPLDKAAAAWVARTILGRGGRGDAPPPSGPEDR
jgi:DEAD/DEAH box helicase domain-containing protein